jgi:hypothetical protein
MMVADILPATLVLMVDPIRLGIVLLIAFWVRSVRAAIVATLAMTVGWLVITLVLGTIAEREMPGIILVASTLSSVLVCALIFGAALLMRYRTGARD